MNPYKHRPTDNLAYLSALLWDMELKFEIRGSIQSHVLTAISLENINIIFNLLAMNVVRRQTARAIVLGSPNIFARAS